MARPRPSSPHRYPALSLCWRRAQTSRPLSATHHSSAPTGAFPFPPPVASRSPRQLPRSLVVDSASSSSLRLSSSHLTPCWSRFGPDFASWLMFMLELVCLSVVPPVACRVFLREGIGSELPLFSGDESKQPSLPNPLNRRLTTIDHVTTCIRHSQSSLHPSSFQSPPFTLGTVSSTPSTEL